MRASAEQLRRFRYALALSIAVHALLLFGTWPALRQSLREPATPPPLMTRIVELAKPEPEPEPAPAPVAKPPPRFPATKKVEPPRPAPQPVPAPSATEAPPVPAPSPAPAPAEPPQVAGAPAASPPVVSQSEARAAEATTAAQYRLQLIAYAQRNKPPYPRIARENNWTGDVTLEIMLRPDGQAELGLRKGSGHEVLDQLALDTYQQALRAVPVPPTLRGRQVRLDPLRLIYNLTEN